MIEINKTRAKNKNYQFCYITLTADGDACRMVVSTPTLAGNDLQIYCDAREDEYKVNVLGAIYPDAKWQDSEGKTDIEKFENWIVAGAINTACLDEDKEVPEQVIEKIAWVDMFGGQTDLEKLTDRVTALETSVRPILEK